jgi:methanogenic corrinoid protein MtbC1/transposase-like protein
VAGAREKTPPQGSTSEPRYRIGLVAKKVGVAAHTLRAWERRYGSLSPGRMAGGGRLYSDDDIVRLRLLKQLTEQGHAIGSIAALPSQELVRMAGASGPRNDLTIPLERLAVEVMHERFLGAIVAFDVTAASRVLSHASMVMSPRDLVCDLLGPLFHEIGARWERGELTVAHEHAASNLLRTELGTLLRSASNGQTGRTLVAATLPGEQHEFGALLASLLAAANGYRVVYLGANLPAADIARAAREAHAQLVLLSMVNDVDEKGEAELEQLRKALPRAIELCIGGRGAHGRLAGKGVRAVSSLPELEAVLAG